MSTHYKWVDRAKGIGILLVVLGHALADMNFNSIIFDVIYSFHMPLFFFASGFCGVKALDMIQRKQKIQYISSRFMRLMIPYFFVGFIYVPLKLFLSSEVRGQVNIKTLPLDFISGNNPNYQLWTLYVLFICATIICVLNDIGYKKLVVIGLALSVFATIINVPIPIFQQMFSNFFFYILGVAYRRNYSGEHKKKELVITSFVLFVGANVLIQITDYEQLKIITGVSGIVLICALCMFMKENKNNIFDVLGKYCMDIYIMANLVQVFVRSILYHKLQLTGVICCVISTLLGVGLPILVSKILLRRVKILKRLVLGESDR